MTDKESEIKTLVENLFNLYQSKLRDEMMDLPKDYEERKKAYIDAKLLETKIYLVEQQLRELKNV